jgi:hypothetical protein
MEKLRQQQTDQAVAGSHGENADRIRPNFDDGTFLDISQ